jgi:hypothetical protein
MKVAMVEPVKAYDSLLDDYTSTTSFKVKMEGTVATPVYPWEEGIKAPDAEPQPKKNKKKKEEAEAAQKERDQRKSVFGRLYPGSMEHDWKHYEGIGWVFLHCEENEFRRAYAECFGSKKWFKRTAHHSITVGGEMDEITGGPRYILKEYADANGWLTCPTSGVAFQKKDGIEVYDEKGNPVWIFRQARRQTDICQVDGRRYLMSALKVLKKGEFGERVLVACCNLDEKKYDVCPKCSEHTEKGSIGIWPGIGRACYSCHKHNQRESGYIQQYNGKTYPKSIVAESKRLGHKVVEGQICATMKHRTVPDLRLYGVELETEFHMKGLSKLGGDRMDMALLMGQALNNPVPFVVFKEDGTLTMNGKYSDEDIGSRYGGFEVVSAPASLAIHREKWPKLSEFKYYDLLRSWDTTTCGFHVHVSRDALNSLQIGRILVFMNHPDNKRFIQKVAGRSEKKFTKYVPKGFTDSLHPERVINPDEQKEHDRARRVAVNLKNPNTIEFRIFRGTVNPRHILRNLEFVDAMCEFTHPASRSLTEMHDYVYFLAFVSRNRKRWPLLAEWLAHPDRKFIELKKPDEEKANMKLLTLRPNEVTENEEKGDEAWKDPEPEKKKPVFASVESSDEDDYAALAEACGEDDDE